MKYIFIAVVFGDINDMNATKLCENFPNVTMSM